MHNRYRCVSCDATPPVLPSLSNGVADINDGSLARRITTAILNRVANIISSRMTRIKHIARGVDKIAIRPWQMRRTTSRVVHYWISSKTRFSERKSTCDVANILYFVEEIQDFQKLLVTAVLYETTSNYDTDGIFIVFHAREHDRQVVRLMGLPYVRVEIFLFHAAIEIPIQLTSLNRSGLSRSNKRFYRQIYVSRFVRARSRYVKLIIQANNISIIYSRIFTF